MSGDPYFDRMPDAQRDVFIATNQRAWDACSRGDWLIRAATRAGIEDQQIRRAVCRIAQEFGILAMIPDLGNGRDEFPRERAAMHRAMGVFCSGEKLPRKELARLVQQLGAVEYTMSDQFGHFWFPHWAAVSVSAMIDSPVKRLYGSPSYEHAVSYMEFASLARELGEEVRPDDAGHLPISRWQTQTSRIIRDVIGWDDMLDARGES